jgi:hypothetical protein
MKKIPLASIIVCLAACAVSSVEPLTVPLVYKASPTPDAVLVAMNCPALARIDVTDRRTAPVLGTRFLENKPLKADVTAANDPVAWAREGVQHFMCRMA